MLLYAHTGAENVKYFCQFTLFQLSIGLYICFYKIHNCNVYINAVLYEIYHSLNNYTTNCMILAFVKEHAPIRCTR